MTRFFALILAALTAGSLLVPTEAEAGPGRRLLRFMAHAAFHHHHHHHHDRPVFVRRYSRPVVVVRDTPRVITRTVTRPVYVEKPAEPAVEETDADEVAAVESENSSIATDDDVAEAKPEKKRASKVAKKSKPADDEDDEEEAKPAKKVASSDLGCKSFFPAVGMTVSVPCE